MTTVLRAIESRRALKSGRRVTADSTPRTRKQRHRGGRTLGRCASKDQDQQGNRGEDADGDEAVDDRLGGCRRPHDIAQHQFAALQRRRPDR